MPRLRLVHVTGAGVDKIPPLPDGVLLCNTFHHGRSIAEHVMMVSMMLLRGVLRSERDMRAGVWSNAIVEPAYPFGGVLAGRTLGVVGFGEIGTAVARLGSAMGMEVRTVRRNPDAPLPSGLDVAWVGGDDQLHELLAALRRRGGDDPAQRRHSRAHRRGRARRHEAIGDPGQRRARSRRRRVGPPHRAGRRHHRRRRHRRLVAQPPRPRRSPAVPPRLHLAAERRPHATPVGAHRGGLRGPGRRHHRQRRRARRRSVPGQRGRVRDVP